MGDGCRKVDAEGLLPSGECNCGFESWVCGRIVWLEPRTTADWGDDDGDDKTNVSLLTTLSPEAMAVGFAGEWIIVD